MTFHFLIARIKHICSHTLAAAFPSGKDYKKKLPIPLFHSIKSKWCKAFNNPHFVFYTSQSEKSTNKRGLFPPLHIPSCSGNILWHYFKPNCLYPVAEIHLKTYKLNHFYRIWNLRHISITFQHDSQGKLFRYCHHRRRKVNYFNWTQHHKGEKGIFQSDLNRELCH